MVGETEEGERGGYRSWRGDNGKMRRLTDSRLWLSRKPVTPPLSSDTAPARNKRKASCMAVKGR